MSGFQRIPDDTILDWARRFAAQPSEQTALMEGDPAIRHFITDCVRPILEGFGNDCRIDPAGNLHAVAGPPSGPIEMAIVAYAMTHPRSTMQDPFGANYVEIDGETALRGRGLSEQKAAMAAALAAFIDVASVGHLPGRIAFLLLTAGETGRHDALAAAFSALDAKPRHAILAIGTDMKVSLGNRGRLDIEVVIEGISAHSSTPWAGQDVTAGIAAILRAADNFSDVDAATTALGPASLTCTSIRTWPEATHTVQSRAHMGFDRRLLPSEDVDEVFNGIKSVFEAATPLTLRVTKGPHMLGSHVARDSPYISRLEQAVGASGLAKPDCYFSYSALDAGYLASKGTPAIMWGPGDPGQFHTDEEAVRVADILAMARMYRAVLAGFAHGE